MARKAFNGNNPSPRKVNPTGRPNLGHLNPGLSPALEDSVREAWVRNSTRLTQFTLEHLRNRKDAYGRYLGLDYRQGRNKAQTIKQCATEEVVNQHFCATDRGDIIGLHTTSPENTCRWLVIDIDHHGDPNAEREARNEKAAFEIARIISEFGLTPLVMKSDGRGGFHIWVIFDMPIPAADLHEFGNAVVQFWQEYKITEPEVFPKQPHLEGEKFGNWVRLPGLHHTHDFYTQVWDGEQWLNGEGAINHILNSKLCPSELLPKRDSGIESEAENNSMPAVFVEDNEPSSLDRLIKKLRGVRRSGGGWIAKCPAHNDSEPSLSVGQGRDGKTLLHCHAGCDYKDILNAVGLEPTDLFPKNDEAMIRELRMSFPESESCTKSLQVIQALHQAALKNTKPLNIDELAKDLGVTPESLNELEVAWCKEMRCWLFPERNGQGKIIGLMKRFRNGSKSIISGGTRGLYIPNSFNAGGGNILIAEGGSDTAAGLSRGWNIIGRPSADGGSQHLINLLQGAKGQIYVIGDNDVKRDGSWPGKKGAQVVGQRLAAGIKAPVLITNPPMKFKDVRAIVQSKELPQ